MLNNLNILPWWLCTQDADSKRGWAATTLINSSLTPGFIPAPFNKTTEKPLLKKPTLDSAEIQNYRPISLHSSLSKTLKCAIYNPIRLQDCSLHWPSSQWLSPSVPPEPHPTHLSLFFLTHLLHLTQSTTKSSSPLRLNSAVSALTWLHHTWQIAPFTSWLLVQTLLTGNW